MLKPIRPASRSRTGGRFVVVASRYNARYVDAMVKAASAELQRAGATAIDVVRVPGAFEIPLIASRLAHTTQPRGPRAEPLSAIICLGVIIRGETAHAAHIGEAVSRALMEIQLRYEVPVIHEVLLLENEAQARARCLSSTHNRGAEAAQTALAMAKTMRELTRR